jgi:hypothetical protein
MDAIRKCFFPNADEVKYDEDAKSKPAGWLEWASSLAAFAAGGGTTVILTRTLLSSNCGSAGSVALLVLGATTALGFVGHLANNKKTEEHELMVRTILPYNNQPSTLETRVPEQIEITHSPIANSSVYTPYGLKHRSRLSGQTEYV